MPVNLETYNLSQEIISHHDKFTQRLENIDNLYRNEILKSNIEYSYLETHCDKKQLTFFIDQRFEILLYRKNYMKSSALKTFRISVAKERLKIGKQLSLTTDAADRERFRKIIADSGKFENKLVVDLNTEIEEVYSRENFIILTKQSSWKKKCIKAVLLMMPAVLSVIRMGIRDYKKHTWDENAIYAVEQSFVILSFGLNADVYNSARDFMRRFNS